MSTLTTNQGNGPVSYAFDLASAVQQTGDTWSAVLADGWDMAGVPNGGYQLAVVSQAILLATKNADVISLQATYVRRAHPGAVDIRVKIVPPRNRRHTASTAIVCQDGREIMIVQALSGDLSVAGSQHLWDASPPLLASPESYPRIMPAEPPTPLPPPLMSHVELRVPLEQLGFAIGKVSGLPIISGWARFQDERPLDTKSLPLFADAFPPPVFNSGRVVGWVPTLTLSLQIRRRPQGLWLAGMFKTRTATHPYLEEDGELWDSSGNLIALSRQLAILPLNASGETSAG